MIGWLRPALVSNSVLSSQSHSLAREQGRSWNVESWKARQASSDPPSNPSLLSGWGPSLLQGLAVHPFPVVFVGGSRRPLPDQNQPFTMRGCTPSSVKQRSDTDSSQMCPEVQTERAPTSFKFFLTSLNSDSNSIETRSMQRFLQNARASSQVRVG